MIQSLRMRRVIYYSFLIFYGAFFCYSVIWSDVGLYRYHALKQEVAQHKRDLATLACEIEGLEQTIAGWQKDSFLLEKMARQELHMGQPKEQVCLMGHFGFAR